MRAVVGAALAAALTIAPAWAEEPAGAGEGRAIAVELNDLQAGDGACRAVFVLNNGLAAPLDRLALRVVAFDTDGHATLFLSLDVGALPIGKTRVLRFDLGEGVACVAIGRLVLDDVTACEGGEATPASCLAAVALSTRAGVPFDF